MPINWNSDLAFFIKQLELGRVSLFLGAGFSVDARNAANESPPLGNRLAELLAKEAGLPYENEPLPTVFEAAQKRLGTKRLSDLIRQLYTIRSFDDWYRIVARITWHRIYTLN